MKKIALRIIATIRKVITSQHDVMMIIILPLCVVSTATVMALSSSLSQRRMEIEQLNRQIEAAEKRHADLHERYQWSFDALNQRIEVMEQKKGKK